jgi:hypothetical protein
MKECLWREYAYGAMLREVQIFVEINLTNGLGLELSSRKVLKGCIFCKALKLTNSFIFLTKYKTTYFM